MKPAKLESFGNPVTGIILPIIVFIIIIASVLAIAALLS